MSLDTVGTLCHEFKILRQESKLNIVYYLGECLKHSFDLVKVCLNYKPNVDIVRERIMFERLVLKDYKLQNYKWFLEPDYAPRKAATGTKYIDFENVVDFVLTQQRIHSYVAKVSFNLLWTGFRLRINFVSILNI